MSALGKKLSDQNQKSELKRAFLCHLPHRVAAIEEAWATLRDGDWHGDEISALYQRVQALAGSSGKFGLMSASESALSLVVFLSNFVDYDVRPELSQIEEVDGLIAVLRKVAEREVGSTNDAPASGAQVSAKSAAESGGKQLVYVLERPPRIRDGLCAALGAVDFTTHTFQDFLALKASLADLRPGLLISDMGFLPELQSTGIINALQSAGPTRVPLMLIGDLEDLEQRLLALRSGCDAILPSRVDNSALVSKAAELMAPRRDERYRILIVEDDPAQAEHIAAILNKVKMRTRAVLEPLEVLENIRDFKPDLILMDLYMPGANGVELTTIIRDYPEFIDIPIVFLSGEHDPEKQLSALSAGGEDFLDKPIRPKHLITTVSNRITRVRALGATLAGSVTRDSVTGLMNRSSLFEQLDGVITGQSLVAMSTGVLFIGIDAVDNLLDTLSLRGIDELLAVLGASLVDQIDSKDGIARFGDYSFVVLAQRPDAGEITDLAETLCKTVENQLLELEQKALSVTASIGIYLLENAVDDAPASVACAEKAYRIARDAGGNRAHTYVSGAPKEKTGKKSQWQEELMIRALEKEGFEVLFQPIVPLRGGEGEHYQTLLRLRGEDGGVIPAAEFIPVAETSDLIVRLDRWITHYALNVIKDRQQAGRKIHLFVSQSVASLNDPGRPAWLQERIQNLDLTGTELTFEFDVGTVTADLSHAKNRFETLQSMGISVLLTRVTGDSAHRKLLKRLMADYVKLAVDPLVGKQEDMVALIEEIHDMGTPVIAPRIENPQVIAQLWISGVDFIQGNFIQTPDEKLGYDFSESILA